MGGQDDLFTRAVAPVQALVRPRRADRRISTTTVLQAWEGHICPRPHGRKPVTPRWHKASGRRWRAAATSRQQQPPTPKTRRPAPAPATRIARQYPNSPWSAPAGYVFDRRKKQKQQRDRGR